MELQDIQAEMQELEPTIAEQRKVVEGYRVSYETANIRYQVEWNKKIFENKHLSQMNDLTAKALATSSLGEQQIELLSKESAYKGARIALDNMISRMDYLKELGWTIRAQMKAFRED